MRSKIETSLLTDLSGSARTSIWIALVAGSSAVFSLALACATPFPALATIAGMRMSRRDALALIGIAWLVNQSIGYLVLGYPQTWDSFAWGGAIGVAAGLAVLAVTACAHRFGATLKVVVLAFLVAFVIYEAALFAATAILPSSTEAFSPAVIAWILWINVLAVVGLAAIHRFAVTMGLLSRPDLMEASVPSRA